MKTSLTPTEIVTMAILANAAEKLREIGNHATADEVRHLLADYVREATREE